MDGASGVFFEPTANVVPFAPGISPLPATVRETMHPTLSFSVLTEISMGIEGMSIFLSLCHSRFV
jgi:hypothetical protein